MNIHDRQELSMRHSGKISEVKTPDDCWIKERGMRKMRRLYHLIAAFSGGWSQRGKGERKGKISLHLLFIIVSASLMLSHALAGSSAWANINMSLSHADITINGVPNDGFGYEMGYSATAGDVNGDGIEDMIIGAYNADPGGRPGAGQVFIFFGPVIPSGTLELPADADVTINGVESWALTGVNIAIADINNDGIKDVIIGAGFADPDGRQDAGQSYVVFGSSTLSGTIELSTDADITLNGISGEVPGCQGDWSGYSVSAGDVNGDGIKDIIIGAPMACFDAKQYAGHVYVVFGSASLSGTIELSTNADITFKGVSEHDDLGLGWPGATSSDVNGDGIEDVIIGARSADVDGRRDAGQIYVFFGSSTLSGTIEVSAGADITINGNGGFSSLDWAGVALPTGDVNGDGIGDIIIGAMGAITSDGDNAGQTYVIFGSPTLSSTMEVSTDANITINGINSWDTTVGIDTGDVNADGYDDIVIIGGLADPGGLIDAGQTYVVYGSATLSGTIELSSGADITLNGINYRDESGWLAGSGDINGDGYDDIITTAALADPPGSPDAGQIYVVFGTPLKLDITPNASCYSAGDLVSLQIAIKNSSSVAQSFKISLGLLNTSGDVVWGMVTSTLNFQAGKGISRTLSIGIPASALDGNYTFEACLFDPNTWKTLARDEETFSIPCPP